MVEEAGGRKVRRILDEHGNLKGIVLEPMPPEKRPSLVDRLRPAAKPPAAAPPPAPAAEAWRNRDRPPYEERLDEVLPAYSGLPLARAIAEQERRAPAPPAAQPAPPPAVAPPSEPWTDERPFVRRFDEVFPAYAGSTLAEAVAAQRPRPEPLATAVLPQVPPEPEPAPRDERPFVLRHAEVFPAYAHLSLEEAIASERPHAIRETPAEPVAEPAAAPARRRVTFEVVRPPAPPAPREARPFMLRFPEVFPAYADLSLADAIHAQEQRPVFVAVLPPEPEPLAQAGAPETETVVTLVPQPRETVVTLVPEPVAEEPPAPLYAPDPDDPDEPDEPEPTPPPEPGPEPPGPTPPPDPQPLPEPWGRVVDGRAHAEIPDLDRRVEAVLAKAGRDAPIDLDVKVERALRGATREAPADYEARVDAVLARRR